MGSIETHYRGCRFRSRLEARWAVFFDRLGVPWRHEEEGYEGRTARWLPDFYLPTLNLHAEVKGPHSPEDFRRIVDVMSDPTNPWFDVWPGRGVWGDYGWGMPAADGISYGLLVLGEVPQVRAASRPRHDLLRSSADDDTVYASTGFFSIMDWGAGIGGQPFFQVAPRYEDIRPPQDREVGLFGALVEMPLLNPLPMAGATHPTLATAYRAARAARFEFGENG